MEELRKEIASLEEQLQELTSSHQKIDDEFQQLAKDYKHRLQRVLNNVNQVKNRLLAKKEELAQIDPSLRINDPIGDKDSTPKNLDFAICFSKTGDECAKTMEGLLSSSCLVRLLDAETADFESVAEESIAKAKALVIVLSKDCLAVKNVVFAMKCAGVYYTRVILLHDAESCKFPGEDEQPQYAQRAGIFHDKAVTYSKEYAQAAAEMILKKIQTRVGKENVHTRAFLSHKRSSAQGLCGRIYQGLKSKYRIFLDTEADFDLHDLQEIVKHTDLFIFILSEGIFESFWCLQELRSAVANKKRILVVKVQGFIIPQIFPTNISDVGKIIQSSTVIEYIPEFYEQFMTRLQVELGPPDAAIKAMQNNDNNLFFEDLSQNSSSLHFVESAASVTLDQIIDAAEVVWGYDLSQLEHLSLMSSHVEYTALGSQRLREKCPKLNSMEILISTWEESKLLLEDLDEKITKWSIKFASNACNQNRLDDVMTLINKNLYSLDLSGTVADWWSLRQLFQAYPQLPIRHLILKSMKNLLADIFITSVGKLPFLETLDLEECRDVTNQWINMLAAAAPSKLTSLNLSHTSVTVDILPYLKTIPSLQELYLKDISLEAGINNLPAFQLTLLDVSNSKLPATAIARLAQIPSLESVKLDNITPGATGVSEILQAAWKLKSLSLANWKLTPEQVQAIAGKFGETLEELNIAGASIGDETLKIILEKIPNLKKLCLRQAGDFHDDSLRIFQESDVSRITHLDLSATLVTNAGLELFLAPEWKSLKLLNVQQCTTSVSKLRQVREAHPNIKILFTRPLYQSGLYKGYYLYQGVQSPMLGTFRFENGKITGEGKDEIQTFTWNGWYSDTQIYIEKAYSSWTIVYEGVNDGLNQFKGKWRYPQTQAADDHGFAFTLAEEVEQL